MVVASLHETDLYLATGWLLHHFPRKPSLSTSAVFGKVDVQKPAAIDGSDVTARWRAELHRVPAELCMVSPKFCETTLGQVINDQHERN